MMHGLGKRFALVAALAVLCAPGEAVAQGGFLWQGIGDIELFKTDSASFLLARGNGRPSALLRFDTWAAAEPINNLVAYVELYGTAGGALQPSDDRGVILKQAALRYSPSDAIVLAGGKIPQVVGAFSSRILSYRNPLIGVPDGYSASYPYGLRVDGTSSKMDYRAGVVSLPVHREGYTPEPGESARPAVGLGFTPFTGLRFGVSSMYGPYLNPDLTTSERHGADWKSFKQGIYAADVQGSRGYFEANAEVVRSTYDVPGYAETSNGLAYYIEGKYTFAPRFYMATRFERNDYPFIAPVSSTFWVANNVAFSDVEVGGGFRAAATTLLKLTVRADKWSPNANPQAPHDNGYSVAFQWSQFVDFMELAARRP